MDGVHSVLSICGERNGRCKLGDVHVLLIRLARANRFPRPTYRDLAEEHDVHPRTIRRICKGLLRLDAGGPIEESDACGDDELDMIDLIVPFDSTITVKCARCGCRSHPSYEDRTLCYACLINRRTEEPEPMSLDLAIRVKC